MVSAMAGIGRRGLGERLEGRATDHRRCRAPAGVSKGSVSFALNDRPGVAPDTRARILAAAEDLGWTPSLRARSLSVGKSFALRARDRPQPRRDRRRPVLPLAHRRHRGRVLDGGAGARARGRRHPGVRSPSRTADSPRTSASTASSSPTCAPGTTASRSCAELGLAAVTLGVPDRREPVLLRSRSTTAPGVRLAVRAPRPSSGTPGRARRRPRRDAALQPAHARVRAGGGGCRHPGAGRDDRLQRARRGAPATEALLVWRAPPDRHRVLERPHGRRRSRRRGQRPA